MAYYDTLDEDQQYAVDEYNYAANVDKATPSAGTKYALEMAREECLLLGIDMSKLGLPKT